MDPLTLATGLAGLLSLAIELTEVCSGYLSGVGKAQKSVEGFILELTSLEKVLLDLKDKVILEPVIAEAFDGRCSSIIENLQSHSTMASRQPAALSLMDLCKTELDTLLKKLKKKSSGSRFRLTMHRLLWPLGEEAMQKATYSLHQYTSIFEMSISIDNLVLNARTHMELKAVRKDHSDWLQSKTTKKILDWLSPLECCTKQRDVASKRHEGTGEWFLASEKFTAWLSGSADSVLWCPGEPGAGKTVITSLVVDHIQAKLDINAIGLAYFYCDYNEQNQQTPSQLIGSLNKQLARQSVPLPVQVKSLYTDSKEPKMPLKVNEQIDLLLQLVVLFPTTFIVIDALDEADDLVHQHRENLLGAIQKLMSSSIRLFVTSRTHARDINAVFQNRPKLRIIADENDVGSYLTAAIEQNEELAELLEENEFKDHVISKIMMGSHGLFLLPALHLRDLHGHTCRADIEDFLDNLTGALTNTYEHMLKRIQRQSQSKVRLATDVLMWASYSKRPLSLDELRQALAVKSGMKSLDTHLLRSPETLVDVCAGLIIVEEESNTVRLIHSTLKEFLQSHLGQFRKPNIHMAQVCLNYLLFDDFKRDVESFYELERLRQNMPFLSYAANHWGHHVSAELCQSAEIIQGEILVFLSECSRVELLFRLISLDELSFSHWTAGYRHSSAIPPILAASFFGLEGVVQLLAKNPSSLESRNSCGATALHWAVWKDERSIVQLLIRAGADKNAKNEEGDTPLHIAALRGHDVLLEQLLASGVNIEQRNKAGLTVLHIAAANGHSTVVKYLLALKADALALDGQGRHVLHHAIDNKRLGRDVETIRLLLEHSVMNQEADFNNMTPLHLAVQSYQHDVISLLLDYGYSVDVPIHRKMWSARMVDGSICYSLHHPAVQEYPRDSLYAGYTPLHAAALFGTAAIVAFFLDRRANPNAQGEFGETPLHLALSASMGETKIEDSWSDSNSYVEGTLDMIVDDPEEDYKEAYEYVHGLRKDAIITLLENRDVDVTIRDTRSRTCLHMIRYSDCEGSEYVAKILGKGCDFNTRNNEGETAVHLAARGGDHESLEIFLRYQADPLMVDSRGRNLIHHACAGRAGCRSVRAVQVLLEHSAAPALLLSTDDQGQNCLHYAVREFADFDMLKLLIDRGVSINHIDNRGRSPTVTAIISADLSCPRDAISTLLELGADPQVTDDSGRNLAHLLVSSGCRVETEILHLLADYKIPINAIDSKGRTVLHHAATSGTLDLPMLHAFLNEWELDINARDNDQRTALDYATVEAGQPRHPDSFNGDRWLRARDLLRDVIANEIKHDTGAAISEANSGQRAIDQCISHVN